MILKEDFMVTTGKKYVCCKCKKLLRGKEGYVALRLSNCTSTTSYSWGYENVIVRIHKNCLKQVLDKYELKKSELEKKHDLMLKRRILKDL